jgi:hypothetical protein
VDQRSDSKNIGDKIMEEMKFGWYNLLGDAAGDAGDGTLCYGCAKHKTTTQWDAKGYGELNIKLACNCIPPEIPQVYLDVFHAARRAYNRKSQGIDV